MNPNGWYADLVLKYAQLWNYFNTPASDGSTSTGDYSIPALGGSPRGWLDLLAGFRYTYLGQQVGLQANNMAIDAASTHLVDAFAQNLTTPGSDLRTLVQQNIVNKLTARAVQFEQGVLSYG